ncbi:MAG: SixA phosphatase family protein [Verrucomicrobiales bacterium]
MELLLVRHGKAEDHGHPGGDGARALTEKGWSQARRVGAFLKVQDWLPDLVLSSPLVRARETAEGLCAAAGIDGPVIESWLACGMRAEEALAELAAYRETCARVCLVGHEPDFSALASAILQAPWGAIEVKKASVLRFQMNPPRAGGILLAALPVKCLLDLA